MNTMQSTSAAIKVIGFVAWRNLWRHPLRTALTFLAFGVGLWVSIVYGAMIAGISKQMRDQATEISLGHVQIHHQDYRKDQDMYAVMPWDLVRQVRQALPPGVTMTHRVYAAGMASAGVYSTGVMLEGIDPVTEPTVSKIHLRLKKGAFAFAQAPGPDGKPRPQVLIGHQLAKTLNLDVGGELVLMTQAADGSVGAGIYVVAGLLRGVDANLDRMGVVMSLTAWQELMALDRGAHELVFMTPDVENLAPRQKAITQVVAEWEARHHQQGAFLVQSWDEINPVMQQMTQITDAAYLIISVIFFGVASLGLINTLLMSVFERSREFGILLALGMRRRWLVLMIILETLFISGVAAVGGSLLGIWGAKGLESKGWDYSNFMPDGFDWAGVLFEPILWGKFEWRFVYQGVIYLLIISLLAALVPAWRVSRMKPLQAVNA